MQESQWPGPSRAKARIQHNSCRGADCARSSISLGEAYHNASLMSKPQTFTMTLTNLPLKRKADILIIFSQCLNVVPDTLDKIENMELWFHWVSDPRGNLTLNSAHLMFQLLKFWKSSWNLTPGATLKEQVRSVGSQVGSDTRGLVCENSKIQTSTHHSSNEPNTSLSVRSKVGLDTHNVFFQTCTWCQINAS